MKPRYAVLGLAAVAAIAIATPAIGAGDDPSGPWAEQAAPAKKVAKKALKKSKKALKKSRKALKKARNASGQQGPQGEQGPAGPQGPSGPEGPAGPQGPAGSNATGNTMGAMQAASGTVALSTLGGTGGLPGSPTAVPGITPQENLTMKDFSAYVSELDGSEEVTVTVIQFTSGTTYQPSAISCTATAAEPFCAVGGKLDLAPRSVVGIEVDSNVLDLSSKSIASWSWTWEPTT